jgi:pimeloyl-ACP methyl ester carboxylesterase
MTVVASIWRGLLLSIAGATAASAAAAAELKACRLPGVEHQALCGTVQRPLDPARSGPGAPTIEVHFAVLPALARNKKPDAVFFLAGGPGQSAIGLAGSVARLTGRLANRRDIVLVDQRGTGRSAPLKCDEPEQRPSLRELADPQFQARSLAACAARLKALPHGDLRQYTTTIAMADLDAVRAALRLPAINLVGASYGTRAALEYQRQFPQAVRRMVIDGVAPPDMVLPASFSTDAQAAWDVLLAACEADARGCAARHPDLRTQWRSLLASLPRDISVPDALTGRDERFTLTREMAAGLLRLPLYVPALAAALPHAVSEAAQGRFTPLVGLTLALGGGPQRRDHPLQLAAGMHFSVICAEDGPRMEVAADKPGADFGAGFADLYQRVCADWPRGAVPPEFYRVGPSASPVLVTSGGADPVTPPRHGERVAKALGPKARHVVVPQAGHGVIAIGCMRDVVFRFIDAEDDAAVAAVEAGCAAAIPRPPAYRPVQSQGGTGAPR